jgi:hypothetical protein
MYTLMAYSFCVYANSVPTRMEFIEAPAFTRHLSDYLNDEQYGELQRRLASNPTAGDLMPGTGGFRKMRWADVRRGKGSRGGLRIIYYHFNSDNQIWLMSLYDKDEASDLTARQKKALKASIESELAARANVGVIKAHTWRRIH